MAEQDARDRAKQDILDTESVFLDMRDSFCKTHPTLPLHLKMMVNCLAPLIAGYHYWCCICSRYSASKKPPAYLEPSIPPLPRSLDDSCTLPYGQPSSLVKRLASAGLSSEKPSTSETSTLHQGPLEAPINYIQSLNSKNVRLQLIDAFNLWFGLPSQSSKTVKEIVSDLHNPSLILDDIQDGSLLRRGGRAAHIIFGKAQSINSATYMFVRAAKQVHALANPSLMTVLLEELDTPFLGQSWELKWRFSEEQDLSRSTRFDTLAQRLGRWYQIRDDYMNLQGEGGYGQKKGFCEDLDEGKFSYLVVRCCVDPIYKDIGMGILHRRDTPEVTKIPLESKIQILDLMKKAGVMHETWRLIMRLQSEVEEEVTSLEDLLGETNPMLRVLVKLLGHIPEPRKQP
ncbi:isoprenoid synthase domain-containing protein [Aspergillus germanicus]